MSTTIQKVNDSQKEIQANTMKYMVATIEGKDIFLQEAEWVLNNKKPIPTGKLVAHKDGDTLNNSVDNLAVVDENEEYGDLHQRSNKVFHEENYKDNEQYIEKHFPDIYNVLFRLNCPEKIV